MQKYKPTPNLSLAGSVAGEESRAVGDSIRLLGAPENHKAGCSGGQDTPDEQDSSKNYSTAVEGHARRLSAVRRSRGFKKRVRQADELGDLERLGPPATVDPAAAERSTDGGLRGRLAGKERIGEGFAAAG